MRDATLQREIDELIQQSQSLREAGRYAESLATLLSATELINQSEPTRPAAPEPPTDGPRPTTNPDTKTAES